MGRTIRYHSIERVVAELKYISPLNDIPSPKTVTIQDSCFTLNLNRAKEICKRIAVEKFNIELICETRIDLMDKEMLDLFKKANFKQIDIGLESAVPAVLKNIQKIRKSGEGLRPEKFYIGKTIKDEYNEFSLTALFPQCINGQVIATNDICNTYPE